MIFMIMLYLLHLRSLKVNLSKVNSKKTHNKALWITVSKFQNDLDFRGGGLEPLRTPPLNPPMSCKCTDAIITHQAFLGNITNKILKSPGGDNIEGSLWRLLSTFSLTSALSYAFHSRCPHDRFI